jgi:hypothetical protein
VKRPFWWAAGSGLVLLSAGIAVFCLRPIPPTLAGTPGFNNLDTLHARCVQDMVANTCKVMGTGSASISAKPGDWVFVAGVGPIDAVQYQQMYSVGDAMCTVVRNACAKQWDGTQCLTARKLWGHS